MLIQLVEIQIWACYVKVQRIQDLKQNFSF